MSINKLKYISTPNLGLKRKLAEYFKVYNIDEFRSSCLNYKTEEKSENLYLPDKQGELRKIHSILTYQTESKRMGCINRDKNAVNNMVKIVKEYIEKKERPLKFRRDYKCQSRIEDSRLEIIFIHKNNFPEKIKDDNPNITKCNKSVKYHQA